MRTLDAYIVRQTFRPLTIAILIALLLLLVERMLRLLDLVLDSQGSLDVLVKLLVFLVPHYLGLALPAAYFIGLMLTFTRLQRDSELDALRAAGIGLHQLLRPAWLMALVLTVVSAVIFSHLQPYARYTYRSLIHTLKSGPLNNYLQNGMFIEAGDTTYMAEKIDSDHRRFLRVFAYREEAPGHRAAMTAKSGQLLPTTDPDHSVLVLNQGVRLDIKPAAGGSTSTAVDKAAPSTLVFNELRVPVELTRERAFRPRGEDERELTLPELWAFRAKPPPGIDKNQMKAEFNDRLVRIVSVIFLPLMAIPLALGSRRSNRSYGIAAGLVILVVYSKALTAGQSFTEGGSVSPILAQWVPLLLFALGSVVLFHRAAFTVKKERGRLGLWPGAPDMAGQTQQHEPSGGREP